MAVTLIKIAIAALGVALVGGADLASANPKKPLTSYQCFKDDGYGRKQTCSRGYRGREVQHARESCFTDDAYGRRKPCTANLKR
jgi:hypothetical protein